MNARFAITVALVGSLSAAIAQAQVQSNAPADRSVAQRVSEAIAKAGIDPRTTSVRVTVTADHTIYITGLISDPQAIKRATSAAAGAAPSYRVVNNIRSSFFDDPNHVAGDKTK